MPSVFLTDATVTTGFDLVGVLQTGVETVQNNVFAAMGVVVPAGIVITAAVVSVKFGMKWLKSLGK